MAKKLSVKIGEYQKDGQTKGRYVNVGVVMDGNNGPYVLLDPSVSLAGLMQLQNTMAMQKGEQVRDRIMCSVFEDQPQGRQQPQQGYQQPQPQQQYQQQQQGYQQQGVPQSDNFDDKSIPF